MAPIEQEEESPSDTPLSVADQPSVEDEVESPVAISVGTSPQVRPLQVNNTVPYSEFILPRSGFVGKVYGVFTPAFIRRMVPRDTKIWIANTFGFRRKKQS